LRDRIRERREDWATSTDRFTPDRIWYAMIACLVTTQQRSLPGSLVDQFLAQYPFPLALETCRQHRSELASFVAVIVANARLRRYDKIAESCSQNFERLVDKGGMMATQMRLSALFSSYQQSEQRSEPFARSVERDTARYLATTLHGIGPKQSRNLLLYVGLLRNELLLDSRVTSWIKRRLASPNLPFPLPMAALQDEAYYSFVVDAVQRLCDEARVLPSDFDAATFYAVEN
jgi:hypothetical protein